MERWRAQLGGAHARGLTTIGLAIGDPLAFADAFIGAMAAGFWVAPLDPSMPWSGSGGLAAALARTGADVVVADRPAAAGVGDELGRACIASTTSTTGRSRDRVRRRRSAPSAGGVVLSSSGTTGTPKVVRLGQEQLLAHGALRGVAPASSGPSDRGFNPLPLFHINAEVVGLLSTLVAGSGLVLDDRFHRTALLGPHGPAGRSRGSTRCPPSSRAWRARAGRDGARRRPLHPLGLGAVAGGGGGSLRGEHGDPGDRDLRHDRGGEPDHGPSSRRSPPRPARSGCRSECELRIVDQAEPVGGRSSARSGPDRARGDPWAVGHRGLRRATRTGTASTRTAGCGRGISGIRTTTGSSTSTPGPTT